ncbi:hypothetical protein GOODEAATRI_010612, partial [Goodea atripinnis]
MFEGEGNIPKCSSGSSAPPLIAICDGDELVIKYLTCSLIHWFRRLTVFGSFV